MASIAPVPLEKLSEIATEACQQALSGATEYDHSKTQGWNTAIINVILAALVKAVPPQSYKFAVNSTIIQHEPTREGAAAVKRGMHAASGAFWNSDKDGSWNFKFDSEQAGAHRAFDIVISVIWIAT